MTAKFCDSCGEPFSRNEPAKTIKMLGIFNIRNTFVFAIGAMMLIGVAFDVFNFNKKNSGQTQTTANFRPLQSQDQSAADQTTIVQSDKQFGTADSRALAVPSIASNQSEINEYAPVEAITTEKNEDLLLKSISEIRNKVNKSWVRPPTAPSGIKCKVRVRLLSNGNIVDAQVVSSSGNSEFDHSAVNAVKRASPLPVPADKEIFAKNFRVFTFTFDPNR